MQSILEQAQKMQSVLENSKKELALKRVEGESGGGMVKVVMTGENKVVSIKIAKEIVNPDDVEMLEDLVVAAVNKASENAAQMIAQEMNKASGFMPNIPGLNFNL